MKIETKYSLDTSYSTGISKSEKTYKIFGIVVLRKIHHYPKAKEFEILTPKL